MTDSENGNTSNDPDGKAARRSRMPRGYWNLENTVEEAKAFLAEHGEERFRQKWMRSSGYRSLVHAINKHGGLARLRQLLGLEEGMKPRGYWTLERTVEEAKAFLAKHGEGNFRQNWIEANGYGSLAQAISKHGGLAHVRRLLGLEEGKKPSGYWGLENTVEEARAFLAEHGEECFRCGWMEANGYGALAWAIKKHGGLAHFRQLLELSPLGGGRQSRAEQAQQQRTINLEALRQTLRNLRDEGVAAARLDASQLLIIAAQAGLDVADMVAGGDVFRALRDGLLLPAELAKWALSGEPEPPVTPGAEPGVKFTSGGGGAAPGGEPGAAPGGSGPAPGPAPAPGGGGVDPGEGPDPTSTPGGGEEPPLHPPTIGGPDAGEELRLLDSSALAAADDEAIAAMKAISLRRLWEAAYADPDQGAVARQCAKHCPRQPWTQEVQAAFLEQHRAALHLGQHLPDSYAFSRDGVPLPPRLMQLHLASQLQQRDALLLLSVMGSGKTLGAQLGVIASGCKRIVVLVLNNCTHQWAQLFREDWTGIDAHQIGTKAFALPRPADRPQVVVIPMHLLSHITDEQIARVVDEFDPDAVILDEVQFIKQRHDNRQSRRREQAAKLLTAVRDVRPNAKVLALSGTAVVNNSVEARKLLELVTGEERPDLRLRGDNDAAGLLRLHQALMTCAIRQQVSNEAALVRITRPVVRVDHRYEDICQTARLPQGERTIALERLHANEKIGAVLQAIDGPTIVSCLFVDGIVDPLRKAIEAAGYAVGVYTGQEKYPCHGYENAIEAFKAGRVDVLLASSGTIGTGLDGLQDVCCRLVIASLPWTPTDLDQLIARLARSGQFAEFVDVVIIEAVLGYTNPETFELEEYSYCRLRWALLEAKRRIANAITDGVLPTALDVSDKESDRRVRMWLKRLESSALVRVSRPLRVPLVFTTPAEEVLARRRYGDWSSCNGRWNAMASDRLHQLLAERPEDWELYQTDLQRIRAEWAVDPLEESIRHCAKGRGLVIGDFGCGLGQLAEALRGRHTVHSFDHVSYRPWVQAVDVAAGVPLEEEVLDLAVFSLSLMGSNWRDQLTAAWPVLKATGQVLIWTAPRPGGLELFQRQLERAGFKAVTADAHDRWWKVWGVRLDVSPIALVEQEAGR